MEIYLKQDGDRIGPFSLEKIQGQLEGGQLTISDAAWFEGCSDWITVKDVPGIMLPGGDHLVEVATVPPFDAYQGDEPYVFVSYAHKDAAMVYEEITRLHGAGINLWYDEGIEASNEWPEEIANAVIDCTVFLIFVSPRATASVNCRNEINLALNKNKPFLAIYLEETGLPPGLQLRMGDLQAILRYKLPVDRYQRKAQGALDQLLGKKPAKQRKAPPIAQQTEATHEPEPAEQAVQTDATTAPSKPRRKGLIVALASVLLIACGALGFLFFGDDGDETEATKEPHKPETTATFTPGQPWTVPTASIEMLWCKPGTFMMGSPESEVGRELHLEGKKTKYNETRHQVTLTKGFYLGKYEVTQAQWKKVLATSPSKFFGENRPVEMVNWPEALRFCQELTLTERKAGRLPDGWEYALPTEAQWEYACRAGTTTVFAFGDSLSSKQANFKGTRPYGGVAVGSNLEQTSDVGSYQPNAWGFYDMHGNVWEWCADWYGNYPTGSLTDPTGPASGSIRAKRSGCMHSDGAGLRSAMRSGYPPIHRLNSIGFRLSLRQTQITPGKPWTVPTASIEMLWCEPGTFMMGSPEGEEGRELDSKGRKSKYKETQHQVTLTKGFYLGKYEVTQAQWKKVMATSPSKFFGENRPVEQVTWTEALRFCQELTLTERKAGRLPDGWEYVLPTEAQWEYACRAGTTTVFSFGDSLSSNQANFNGTKAYGGAKAGPFLERTTDVGSYAANPWGFHDMHGNVSESCADWHGKYPTGSLTDPTGPASGLYRVGRGGAWQHPGMALRSAENWRFTPSTGYSALGFRLSLQQTKVEQPEQPTPGQPWTVPTASIEMLWCEPGAFLMGSPENEVGRELDSRGMKGKYDETRHQVTLTKGFYLGKYEVTQTQWAEIMGTNPSKFKGANLPVELVSWNDATAFCVKLTEREREAGHLPDGWEYALPTEAQWEYACRAGTTMVFAFGDAITKKQANFESNIGKTTTVGLYPANAWGFRDLHGNVWEWCSDWYGQYPTGSVTDPTASSSGLHRVLRGGAWNSTGTALRSAGRNNYTPPPESRNATIGFRLSLRNSKPGTGTKEAVVITDKALEAALRKSLNKPAGPITPADLASIESFYASKVGIIDLTPLAHCANLTTLFLSDNQITNLTPLAHCSKLRDLELGGNQITDLRALSGLTKLTRLRLYRNRVTDVAPLAGLTNLSTLYLDENQITDLRSLAGLTKLERLWLYQIQIADLKPLSSLGNLIWLNLDDNQITDLSPLAGLTKLQELRLSKSPITDFAPLAKLTNLIKLHLKEIQITDDQKNMLRNALPKCEISF